MKKIVWILLLCLSLLPYVVLILAAISSYFFGSGLVGDTGDLSSGIFVAMFFLATFWPIYGLALGLMILSIKKLKQIQQQDIQLLKEDGQPNENTLQSQTQEFVTDAVEQQVGENSQEYDIR